MLPSHVFQAFLESRTRLDSAWAQLGSAVFPERLQAISYVLQILCDIQNLQATHHFPFSWNDRDSLEIDRLFVELTSDLDYLALEHVAHQFLLVEFYLRGGNTGVQEPHYLLYADSLLAAVEHYCICWMGTDSFSQYYPIFRQNQEEARRQRALHAPCVSHAVRQLSGKTKYLEQSVRDLSSDKQVWCNAHQEVAGEVQSLTATISELMRQQKTTEAENAALIQKNKALQQQLDAKALEVEEQQKTQSTREQKAKEEVDHRVRSLEEEKAALTRKNEALQQQLDAKTPEGRKQQKQVRRTMQQGITEAEAEKQHSLQQQVKEQAEALEKQTAELENLKQLELELRRREWGLRKELTSLKLNSKTREIEAQEAQERIKKLEKRLRKKEREEAALISVVASPIDSVSASSVDAAFLSPESTGSSSELVVTPLALALDEDPVVTQVTPFPEPTVAPATLPSETGGGAVVPQADQQKDQEKPADTPATNSKKADGTTVLLLTRTTQQSSPDIVGEVKELILKYIKQNKAKEVKSFVEKMMRIFSKNALIMHFINSSDLQLGERRGALTLYYPEHFLIIETVFNGLKKSLPSSEKQLLCNELQIAFFEATHPLLGCVKKEAEGFAEVLSAWIDVSFYFAENASFQGRNSGLFLCLWRAHQIYGCLLEKSKRLPLTEEKLKNVSQLQAELRQIMDLLYKTCFVGTRVSHGSNKARRAYCLMIIKNLDVEEGSVDYRGRYKENFCLIEDEIIGAFEKRYQGTFSKEIDKTCVAEISQICLSEITPEALSRIYQILNIKSPEQFYFPDVFWTLFSIIGVVGFTQRDTNSHAERQRAAIEYLIRTTNPLSRLDITSPAYEQQCFTIIQESLQWTSQFGSCVPGTFLSNCIKAYGICNGQDERGVLQSTLSMILKILRDKAYQEKFDFSSPQEKEAILLHLDMTLSFVEFNEELALSTTYQAVQVKARFCRELSFCFDEIGCNHTLWKNALAEYLVALESNRMAQAVLVSNGTVSEQTSELLRTAQEVACAQKEANKTAQESYRVSLERLIALLKSATSSKKVLLTWIKEVLYEGPEEAVGYIVDKISKTLKVAPIEVFLMMPDTSRLKDLEEAKEVLRIAYIAQPVTCESSQNALTSGVSHHKFK